MYRSSDRRQSCSRVSIDKRVLRSCVSFCAKCRITRHLRDSSLSLSLFCSRYARDRASHPFLSIAFQARAELIMTLDLFLSTRACRSHTRKNAYIYSISIKTSKICRVTRVFLIFRASCKLL